MECTSDVFKTLPGPHHSLLKVAELVLISSQFHVYVWPCVFLGPTMWIIM